MIEIQPFQQLFLTRAFKPEIDTAALSLPRGNGKSTLAAYILQRALTPGDALHVEGSESLLVAGSIPQARMTVFSALRKGIESLPDAKHYRYNDTETRCGITDTRTNTRLRVMSSNAKRAQGIVNCPLLVADEPGAWETIGGERMHDAIQTALGKPGSTLRAIYIGTLAPAVSGWWHALVERGTGGSRYVQALQGDIDKWQDDSEIARCNPLSDIDAKFWAKLLEERNDALKDSRLKARFLSYRLNRPSQDESVTLLSVADWQRALDRKPAKREGRPIVGIDLGGGRAWSAAVAMWRSGRIEALAVAPGLPDLAEQERRDLVPAGTYQKLADAGSLVQADGLRVPPPALLCGEIMHKWGAPEVVFCDRFRLAELQDCALPCRVVPRVTRWSESSADIRALRKMAADGPMSVGGQADLFTASLAVAMVKPDDAGNVRLIKRGSHNTARDDVAAALVLAAGAFDRKPKAPKAPRLAIAS